MSNFKTLEYKNIQSVGNHAIKIQLDRSSTTLIGGSNGSGKSTFFYAFTFLLFGKFPSGAKLADVINSVNKKGLEVKGTFTERGDDYMVIRGEKPKKFEIYKNDELIDQTAHSRDYQKLLETIIGMDYKLFTQIVMLNKERYIPFMQMATGDRRKVIEDILDISIFTEMNNIVKAKIKETQQTQANLNRDLQVKNAEMSGQQKLVQQMQESMATQKNSSTQNINEKNQDIDLLKTQIADLQKESDLISIAGHDAIKKQKREFNTISIQFEQKIKTANSDLSFFEKNDHCPTCGQDIEKDLKEQKQHECNEKVNEVQSIIVEMMKELDKVIKQDESFVDLTLAKQTLTDEIKLKTSARQYIERELGKLIEESKNTSNDGELQVSIDLYHSIENEVDVIRGSLNDVLSDASQYEMLRTILKDDGIKSVIIKEYMSLINSKINEYLQAMDFYINMFLDENFKESFGAIHKENFTMNNLSTGQKARVNIAIWLALLEVASIKNSVVSNVIMMDEILENVDAEGVTHVMNLFKDKLADKNIFLVTQRFNEFEDLFRSSIQFKIDQGFTVMQ
jgi:DNA repair exonuclease SbcCD ATPase subunit